MSAPWTTPKQLTRGAVGVPFVATVQDPATNTARDLSSYTSRWIVFRKPSGKVEVLTATFTTDGTDGKVQALSTENLLDEIGVYYWSARLRKTADSFDASEVRTEIVGTVSDLGSR